MNNNNYRTPIIVVIIGIVIIIALSVVYVLTSDDRKEPKKTGSAPTPVPSQSLEPEDILLGGDDEEIHSKNVIIKAIDLDNAFITVQERGTALEEEYTYNGATDIRTAHGRQITAALLSPGDFVRIFYNEEMLLRSVNGSKDVELYKNVLQRTQDDDLRKITIGSDIYRFDDYMLVLNNGEFVELDSLRNMDIISLYSVDNVLYMIKVENGHGYFTLNNYDGFIGGTLNVGRYQTFEIVEDMELTLAEGEYDIEVVHEDFLGTASIRIDRDMTTVLDLAAYSPSGGEKGYVRLEIEPEGADLYVDGIRTSYDNAVELTKGEHWIQAVLGGYNSYTGFIDIGDSIEEISISLSPASAKVSGDIMLEDIPVTVTENLLTPTPAGSSSDYVNAGIQDSTSETLIDDNTASETVSVDPSQESTGDLTPEPLPESTDEPSIGSGETGEEDTSGSDAVPAEGSMIFKCTEGAAVFVNDVYKGEISGGKLSTRKIVGTLSIRLTKQGYITKKYTVTVEDDGEDAEFVFPDMVLE
ncbi:MAG: hypothetical protein K6G81_10740 [Lachnospiraceae bacterium]|nr:hypothetical protein [Lachnospiraceae bacterium]